MHRVRLNACRCGQFLLVRLVSDLAAKAEEAARCVAEEKEFRGWMQFVGLGQFSNSCIAAGYGSLETIQMRNEKELDEWAVSCSIPSGFHRRLRDKKATIEGFRHAFQAEQIAELNARRRKLQEELEMARRAEEAKRERDAIHKACTQEVEDLGLAWYRLRLAMLSKY